MGLFAQPPNMRCTAYSRGCANNPQILPNPIGRTNSMNPFHRLLVCAVVTAITVLGAAQVRADDGQDQDGLPNRYVVTNLTSDLTSDILGVAPKTDPVLQNAWG